MADSKSSFIVFSGTCTQYLTEKICQNLNMPMGNMQVTRFSDGEFEICFEESIRGKDVFLVQST
ncbi:MAG: ribose-phosphate pyrophosphokinase-like domain-containing protein, partial [Bacteroidaceae bacterium]|nr:ribose-phosphate pyrophosphokinase-like domain-containing protein [Bacteroidaceae bacterium]